MGRIDRIVSTRSLTDGATVLYRRCGATGLARVAEPGAGRRLDMVSAGCAFGETRCLPSQTASELPSLTTTKTSLFRSRTGRRWMSGRPSPYLTTISRIRRGRRAPAAIRHRLRDAGAHADDARHHRALAQAPPDRLDGEPECLDRSQGCRRAGRAGRSYGLHLGADDRTDLGAYPGQRPQSRRREHVAAQRRMAADGR